MDAAKVFFVHLRRPGKDDPRTDPFYEFGSFGCTGCHKKNLLHSKNMGDLEGAKLAFAQGGRLGFRLVFLTPPITIVRHATVNEVKWSPKEMPFRYECAPVLVRNDHDSDFPLVSFFASRTLRSTVEGGLSSRIRSSVKALPRNMATQVVEVYERLRANCESSCIAKEYWEALPYHNTVESKQERKSHYQNLPHKKSKETSKGLDSCNHKETKSTRKC